MENVLLLLKLVQEIRYVRNQQEILHNMIKDIELEGHLDEFDDIVLKQVGKRELKKMEMVLMK